MGSARRREGKGYGTGTTLVAALVLSCASIAFANPIVRTPGTIFPRHEGAAAPMAAPSTDHALPEEVATRPEGTATTGHAPPQDQAGQAQPPRDVQSAASTVVGTTPQTDGRPPANAIDARASTQADAAGDGPTGDQGGAPGAMTFAYDGRADMRVGQASDMGHATIRNGVAPYIFAVSGALPTGLTLDPATGDLTGTPDKGSEGDFTVLANDAKGAAAKVVVHVAEPSP